jgi:hypothetical protein
MKTENRLRLEVMRKFPTRGTRKVPNKNCMILLGTRQEIREEIAALIAADTFSYGKITRIDLFDLKAFNADPLKAVPIQSFNNIEEVAQ